MLPVSAADEYNVIYLDILSVGGWRRARAAEYTPMPFVSLNDKTRAALHAKKRGPFGPVEDIRKNSIKIKLIE